VDLSEKLAFCHDVGFVVQPDKPDTMDIVGFDEKVDEAPLVGLNTSGLLFMGGYSKDNMFGLKCDYQRMTYDLIDYLIDRLKTRVLLVPHVFGQGINAESDAAVCEKLYHELRGKYPGRLGLVQGEYNQNEIKYIIGLCDFFIGARMHACIAALSQGIPAVGVAYSKKFQGVFETVGVGNLIADLRNMDVTEILHAVSSAFENQDRIRDILKKRVPEAQNNVFDIFKNIVLNPPQILGQ